MAKDTANADALALQPESKDPAISFRLFKSLPIKQRMYWVAAFIALGLILQIALLSALPGLPFIFIAILLTWVVGFDNKIDFHHMRVDSGWEQVDFSRLKDIGQLDTDIKHWDTSLWDLSNAKGLMGFLFVGVLILLTWWGLWEISIPLGNIIAADGALLLISQWFNGMRRVDRRPDLVLKVDHLLKTVEQYQEMGTLTGKLGAQLLLNESQDQRVPVDAKAMVTYPDGPEYLYGVQSQVVINRVQGRPYPYCYSVIVAKAGHDLIKQTQHLRLSSNIIRETQTKDGVDVVIFRQRTSRTSGYHTKVKTSALILGAALQNAEAYIDSHRKTSTRK
ncbi:MAG TPA: hypothetical protein ENI80_03635 [Acidiferrobacteraceae bacterium]|nr:hypothetical protein [Acidiferrobacteraceae bacterium]